MIFREIIEKLETTLDREKVFYSKELKYNFTAYEDYVYIQDDEYPCCSYMT